MGCDISTLIHGPLTGHNDQVYFVAFSPDSKKIISASCYGSICVWNADTGVLVSGPLLQHTEGALIVAFTPSSTYSAILLDGKWIAACDKTVKAVHVWNLKTGQLVASLDKHTDNVTCVTFSPDSRHVLTASHNKTILVHA